MNLSSNFRPLIVTALISEFLLNACSVSTKPPTKTNNPWVPPIPHNDGNDGDAHSTLPKATSGTNSSGNNATSSSQTSTPSSTTTNGSQAGSGIDSRLFGVWVDQSGVFAEADYDTSDFSGTVTKQILISISDSSVTKSVVFTNSDNVSCKADAVATAQIDPSSISIQKSAGGAANTADNSCGDYLPQGSVQYKLVDDNHLSVSWYSSTGVLTRQ